MRNALAYVPKTQQSMAAAALRQAFPQPDHAQASVMLRHRSVACRSSGSAFKGNARPDSDVDLLVEFFSDEKPSLFDLAEIEQELWRCSRDGGRMYAAPRI
jgi:predicted nucleotidyltransferase